MDLKSSATPARPSHPMPELLAPVSTRQMLLAAIHNGADAIYMGMPGFNARARANTMDMAELGESIALCHLYGLKAYVAWNTLLLPGELESARHLIPELIGLCPDAIIVQDIGLARLIRHICPSQIIHASTQMTITSSWAMEALEDLDIRRFILARELSLRELETIRQHTTRELEVFVHGALCISCSGQCLASFAMGGRSANRGQCAQSCRLPYDLLLDGQEQGPARYLLSPTDLCTTGQASTLARMGIQSLKIEGRLKSPHYVAAVLQAYGSALGRWQWQAHMPPPHETMALTFGRRFSSGWLEETFQRTLMEPDYSGDRGLRLGSVHAVQGQQLLIHQVCRYTPQAGDGLLLVQGKAEHGGSVYGVAQAGTQLTLTMGREFPAHTITPGADVFITSAPAVEKELERSWTDQQRQRTIPLRARLQGRAGAPLELHLHDEDGHHVRNSSQIALEPASRAPLDETTLRKHLGALGRTPFAIEQWEVDVEPGLFLPNSELKELRRAAVEALIARRSHGTPPPCVVLPLPAVTHAPQCAAPRLHLLLRNEAQLDALPGIQLPMGTVYLDLPAGQDPTSALRRLRDLGYATGLCTPALLKPHDGPSMEAILNHSPDTLLIRSLSSLGFVLGQNAHPTLVGDMRLNITNPLSFRYFLEKGLHRLCPSPELEENQLWLLLEQADPGRMEVPVHFHPAMFHMGYCLFSGHLAAGRPKPACGLLCQHHLLEIRDRKGQRHMVQADATCANTIYHGQSLNQLHTLPGLLGRGVRDIRLEFLDETPAQARGILEEAARLLTGKALQQAGAFAPMP
ncbi:U32 family peptidase [Desulfurispirillum indicum]|nr:U32 family peptidase [Desulfurispirillum indicum]